MRRTWKDDVIVKLDYINKKHKKMHFFIMGVGRIVEGIYNISDWICHNTKRLLGIVAVSFVFIISTSFAFPVYQEGYYFEEYETGAEDVSVSMLNKDEALYSVETTEIPIEDLLDDEDVLKGYDNSELDNLDDAKDAEYVSLDDMLGIKEVNKNIGITQDSKAGLSVNDWQLVLINKQHPVPSDYSFTLGNISGNMQCDERIIGDLKAMFQAAKDDGVNLIVCSPYRDYNRQTVLFNRKIDNYMAKGYSYLEAYKIASVTVTVPGASEHQIGLAVDIISDQYSQLNMGFGKTEAGMWLKEHSKEYGFILRYPEGKEYITGIQYEPWHFRYVGKTAATIIMNQGITLEELIENL